MRRAKRITALAVAAAMVFSNVAYAAPGTDTTTTQAGAESAESLNSQSDASGGIEGQASDQTGNGTDSSAQAEQQTETKKTDTQNTTTDAGSQTEAQTTQEETAKEETTKDETSSQTPSTDTQTQETPSTEAEAQKAEEKQEASKTEEEKVLYDITFETPEKHGKVTDMDGNEVADGKTLKTDENGKVQFKVKADDGYQVSAVYQMPDEKTPLRLVKDSYYELQVDENTTVKVVYQKIPEANEDGEDADSEAEEPKEDADTSESKETEQSSQQEKVDSEKTDSKEETDTKEDSSATADDQQKKSPIASWFSAEPSNEVNPYEVEDDATGQTYFKVSFVDENGLSIWGTQYVLEGSKTSAPILSWENVTEAGKHFLGWKSSVDEQIYTSDQIEKIIVDQDTKYTAVFTTNQKYEVRIEYVYADQEGNRISQAAQPFIAEVNFGEGYTKTVESPVISGFEADQKSVTIQLDEREEDYVVTVKYKGEPKDYTVVHQQEQLDGSYLETDRETKTGTIGLETDAQPQKYEGFTAQPIENVVLQNNEETTIYVNYTRNSYVLTYNSNGGTYVGPKTLKFGMPIEYPDDSVMKRMGYDFGGWVEENAIKQMPAENLTVNAIWNTAKQASYTVVYWLENFTGGEGMEGYDYITAETKNGDVGQNTTYDLLNNREWEAANIDPTGVELDDTKTQNTEIQADGSTVVNVFYNRKEFTIRFYESKWVQDGWFDGHYEAGDELDDLRITAKYGESIIRKWGDDEHIKSKWYTQPGGTTAYTMLAYMPAQNISVYQGNRDSGGTITWYIEGLNGNREVYMRINTSRTSTLSDEDKSPIEGFTFDSWQESGRNKWLYYTRNSYTLSFENASGIANGSVRYETNISSARPNDSDVKPPEGIDSDSTFGGWYYSPACESGTEVKWDSDKMPAHNVRVYAKWIPAEYTLSFETNGAENIPSQTLPKYTEIKLPGQDPVKDGYTFLGWYLDSEFKQPFTEGFQILKDTTLYAKWAKENETFKYTVQYVDSKGDPIPGVESEILEGEKGSTVTINAKDIDGWYPVVSSKNVTLTEDGMIIQMEYEKAETWKYTIKYVESNSNPENEIKEAVEKTTSSSRVVEYAPNIKGYVLSSDTFW